MSLLLSFSLQLSARSVGCDGAFEIGYTLKEGQWFSVMIAWHMILIEYSLRCFIFWVWEVGGVRAVYVSGEEREYGGGCGLGE